jgi:ElaB/YqjD/DUF883 family membrane-anchored ribosome-binding protein
MLSAREDDMPEEIIFTEVPNESTSNIGSGTFQNKQAVEDVRSAAQVKAQELRQAAATQAEELRARARRAFNDVRSHLLSSGEEAEYYIRQNPTKSVLLAFGTGLLAALIWRKK